MYFPLEVNAQLANAMRMATEVKIEVEKIIGCVCVDENGTLFIHFDTERGNYHFFRISIA